MASKNLFWAQNEMNPPPIWKAILITQLSGFEAPGAGFLFELWL